MDQDVQVNSESSLFVWRHREADLSDVCVSTFATKFPGYSKSIMLDGGSRVIEDECLNSSDLEIV